MIEEVSFSAAMWGEEEVEEALDGDVERVKTLTEQVVAMQFSHIHQLTDSILSYLPRTHSTPAYAQNSSASSKRTTAARRNTSSK